MACVLIPFRREKARADNFLITASVSLLNVELRKKRWYPHKLAVFWKKRKAKYSTKPVAWFGGVENGYRGVHFWPEPDPVDSKVTLLKNPEDEMTDYQEKQWNIYICNVSPSGCHQLLATGCIDISNYITEMPGKVDVTVTLKPAIKKVVSGKIEFELSWIIQEDDRVIHPTDEEIWEEIMQEVREEQARRKAEGKTAKYKSLKKRRCKKRGCSSGTDIAVEEDKKKDKSNEVGCSSGTDIAVGKDKKTIEQQGGISPNAEPQVDPSSGSNTKVGSGKVRRQSSPHHAHLSPAPPQPHPSANQGLPSESEEKKGVQSKRNLHKSVRFQIDEQPEVLHLVVHDEEAMDSLSVLSSETVYIEEDEVATKEKCIPKRDENSSSSGSQLHSELASYVEEELKLVQDELLSSEEVRSKVKLEMQRAMSSDHKAEFESLNQGWLILDNFHSKVMKRKDDLLALIFCILILDWRKTDENKAHEKRVAGLITAIRQWSLHA
ncbi:unnamed protein product [Pocillopora meandrina]|uniref:C2 NT-type domain-containing protein n=1 Tax=Pocillopora meandrina TaxID=46732 RepID=A0AAU9XG89_9CNID|nr:unnamed protein product [Pocillopora meandrina]